MEDPVRELHPTRRPLLLVVAGLIGSAFLWQAQLGWLVLPILVGAGLVWYQGPQRWRLMPVVLALSFTVGLAYTAWRNHSPPEALVNLVPNQLEVALLQGIVREGTGGIALDDFHGPDDEFGVAAPQEQLPAVFLPIGERPSTFLIDIERLGDRKASGTARVYVKGSFACRAGERLKFWGNIERPPKATNPGEPDIREIWALRGIHHTVRIKNASQLERLGQTSAFQLTQLSETVRGYVAAGLAGRLSPTSLALFRCMVLGDRSALSPQMRRAFVETGSVHLLVVSGLHVMILCFGATLLLRLMRVRLSVRLAFSSMIALGFLVVTGGQIATLRAVVMVLLYNVSQWRGRSTDVLNLLLTSAFIVFLRDPNDVLGWGFWLSYLAVLGLSTGFTLLKRSHEEEEQDVAVSPPLFALRFAGRSFASSCFALLATLPLTLKGWHIVSPVGVFVNLLVIVPVYATLGLALLVPFIHLPLIGDMVAVGLEVSLGALWRVVGMSRNVEASHLWLLAPSWPWIVSYYAALTALVLVRHRVPWRKLAFAGVSAVLVWLPWSFPSVERLARFSVLDVRQGACAVFEDGNGGVAVFDCGSQGRPHVGTWTLVPFLLERGHRSVDLLVLSHADADHINGLVELTSALKVREVWVSSDFPEGDVLEVIRSRCETLRRVRMGQNFRFGGDTTLEVIWPDVAWRDVTMSATSESNEGSMVVRLAAPWLSALITGDAEDRFVAGLGDRLQVCDVVLAPHHGSPFACVDELLTRTRPSTVVVSARRGFSPPSLLERYAGRSKVWQTGEEGYFTVTGEGWGD